MPTKLGRLEDARTLRLASRRIVGGQLGHAPTSAYVETFWLPVLGPSTTWLIRLLNLRLDREGENVEISVADAGRALGLGERPGRHSPLIRALGRAADFDLIMRATPVSNLEPADPTSNPQALTLLVRRSLPPLPTRLVERLPPLLAREHHECAIAATVRVLGASRAALEHPASSSPQTRRRVLATLPMPAAHREQEVSSRGDAVDRAQPIASRYAN